MSIQKHRFLLLRLELCLCGWKYEYKAVIDFKKKNIGFSGCSFLFQIFFLLLPSQSPWPPALGPWLVVLMVQLRHPCCPVLLYVQHSQLQWRRSLRHWRLLHFTLFTCSQGNVCFFAEYFTEPRVFLSSRGTLTWSCFCALCLNSLSKCSHTQPLLSCVTQSLHLNSASTSYCNSSHLSDCRRRETFTFSYHPPGEMLFFQMVGLVSGCIPWTLCRVFSQETSVKLLRKCWHVGLLQVFLRPPKQLFGVLSLMAVYFNVRASF